jgi:intergrase/recombinase
MELFEYLNVLVTRPAEWSDVTPGEKRKWYFLMQRRMAIGHPEQANALQHLKINQSAVADFWHRFMMLKYQRKMPNWMYTKGVAKAQKEKEKKLDVSEKMVFQFAKSKGIDVKSVRDALELFPTEIVKEIKAYEKTSMQK